MSSSKAVLMMLVVTLMWSTAGIVTRQLDSAQIFEVTFWRSMFNAAALFIGLTVINGRKFWLRVLMGPRAMWLSGICWACMFTAFMVALTLTSVANVLVTLSIGPLLTALVARIFLNHKLPAITWLAIFFAGAGIAWMFSEKNGQNMVFLGTLVAMVVPLASACNFALLHSVNLSAVSKGGNNDSQVVDMLPAVFIGAFLSALATLPFAWPFHGSTHDILLLLALGVFQLALPCFLLVRVSMILPAPDIALIGLMEVVFGIAWVWIWAGEQPTEKTMQGGALVVGALLFNQFSRIRNRSKRL